MAHFLPSHFDIPIQSPPSPFTPKNSGDPDAEETLERLEQSQKVAGTIEAAFQLEMARKKALLHCFLSEGIDPPAPEAAEPTPTGSAAAPPSTPARAQGGEEGAPEMSDQEAVDLVKVGFQQWCLPG